MFRDEPIDPFQLKYLSKLHPYRLVWTAYNRMLNYYGQLIQKPLLNRVQRLNPPYLYLDRGSAIADTAVTSQQMRLLKQAVQSTVHCVDPIVEVGSYRGVTTQELSASTSRLVFAVDPYIGYGGWESDLVLFEERTKHHDNIQLIRMTSGKAFQHLQGQTISLVFIDAVHDFANTWFDFCVWSSLVIPSGLIAIHDVDDFPGTYLAFNKILNQRKNFRLWGYCPNLAIFQKIRD